MGRRRPGAETLPPVLLDAARIEVQAAAACAPGDAARLGLALAAAALRHLGCDGAADSVRGTPELLAALGGQASGAARATTSATFRPQDGGLVAAANVRTRARGRAARCTVTLALAPTEAHCAREYPEQRPLAARQAGGRPPHDPTGLDGRRNVPVPSENVDELLAKQLRAAAKATRDLVDALARAVPGTEVAVAVVGAAFFRDSKVPDAVRQCRVLADDPALLATAAETTQLAARSCATRADGTTSVRLFRPTGKKAAVTVRPASATVIRTEAEVSPDRRTARHDVVRQLAELAATAWSLVRPVAEVASATRPAPARSLRAVTALSTAAAAARQLPPEAANELRNAVTLLASGQPALLPATSEARHALRQAFGRGTPFRVGESRVEARRAAGHQNSEGDILEEGLGEKERRSTKR